MLRIDAMTDAHGPSLEALDLNLLVVFDAIYTAGSVTAAGHRLGLSQSGTSRALARLREALGDPLFVSGRRGLQPTPRAEGLREPVRDALERLATALGPPRFEAATCETPLRLGCPDHLAWLLAGPLRHTLRSRAPNMEVVFTSFSSRWIDDLHEGYVDLAFGVLDGTEAHLRRRSLFDDAWAVVMRADHPDLDGPWDVSTFARGEHGVMAVAGTGPSHVDRALARLGLQRRVVLRASSPMVVAVIARETDLKVTTSAWFAAHLATRLGLAFQPVPLDASPLPLPLVWHERYHDDPRHRFVRELLTEVVETVRPGA